MAKRFERFEAPAEKKLNKEHLSARKGKMQEGISESLTNKNKITRNTLEMLKRGDYNERVDITFEGKEMVRLGVIKKVLSFAEQKNGLKKGSLKMENCRFNLIIDQAIFLEGFPPQFSEAFLKMKVSMPNNKVQIINLGRIDSSGEVNFGESSIRGLSVEQQNSIIGSIMSPM
ncbi:hypothetical protein ACFL21_04055 [Patescibacteria group bacterium]